MAVLAAVPACAALAARGGETAVAREPTCRPSDAAQDPAHASWATRRHATLLVDSVLLSAYPGIKRAMACWRLAKRGRPAWMLRAAELQLGAAGRRVSPLVVVGIGYNSLWERNRRNYDRWVARFDGEAERLVATLKRLGARRIVWVTLREPRPATAPGSAVGELSPYSWYFP